MCEVLKEILLSQPCTLNKLVNRDVKDCYPTVLFVRWTLFVKLVSRSENYRKFLN